jgi:deoxyribonuclease-1-like protein
MRIALAIALSAIIAVSGCITETGEIISDPEAAVGDSLGFLWEVVFGPGSLIQPRDSIRIASWNIENFGRSKANDPWKMERIASILSQYDIIAVQEISNIREQSDPDCPRNEDACPGDPACGIIGDSLEEHLNGAMGLDYRFVFSPQVKDERYLFIYNSRRVDLLDSMLMEDPDDVGPICSLSPVDAGLMVRQPFMGVFRSGDFDFVLINVHTSPSANLQELEGLEYFYRQAENLSEPDVIILGDLNADCSYLADDEEIGLTGPGYIWVVDDEADTTAGDTNCAYDRFVFKSHTKQDYTGGWGIDMDIPENVSDHYLVWAEFYTKRDTD